MKTTNKNTQSGNQTFTHFQTELDRAHANHGRLVRPCRFRAIHLLGRAGTDRP